MQRAHSQVIRTTGESYILNISKTLNIELRLHFLIGKQNMRMGSLGLGLDTGTRKNATVISDMKTSENYF